jgi:hypothetical protein
MKIWVGIGAAMLIAASAGGLARAQTDATAPAPDGQHDRGAKLRAACQADIDKLCPGLDPGRATFRCVREHQDDLSDTCKTALAAARSGGHWRHGDSDQGGQPGPAGSPQDAPAQPAPPPSPPN